MNSTLLNPIKHYLFYEFNPIKPYTMFEVPFPNVLHWALRTVAPLRPAGLPGVLRARRWRPRCPGNDI